jgi:hypothetical protein
MVNGLKCKTGLVAHKPVEEVHKVFIGYVNLLRTKGRNVKEMVL